MTTPAAIRKLDQEYRLAKYLETPNKYLDPGKYDRYEFPSLPMPPKRPLNREERAVMATERAAERNAATIALKERERAERRYQDSLPTLREYLKKDMKLEGTQWDDAAKMTFTSSELDAKEIITGNICTDDGVFTIIEAGRHEYTESMWIRFP